MGWLVGWLVGLGKGANRGKPSDFGSPSPLVFSWLHHCLLGMVCFVFLN